MRNLKRVLSLGMTAAMITGLMVVGTSAASYADVSTEDNVEAIEVLQSVGVMVGDSFLCPCRAFRHLHTCPDVRHFCQTEERRGFAGKPERHQRPFLHQYLTRTQNTSHPHSRRHRGHKAQDAGRLAG